MVISAWKSKRRSGWISSGITGRLVERGGMFLVALVLFCTGCLEQAPVRLAGLSFQQDGVGLSLTAPLPGGQLRVETPDGLPIQTLPLATDDAAPRLFFPWISQSSYQFTLIDASGAVLDTRQAQAPVREPWRALLHAPYGQLELPLQQALRPPAMAWVTPDASIQVGLALRLDDPAPQALKVEARVEGAILELPLDSTVSISAQSPSAQLSSSLRLLPGVTSARLELTVRGGVEGQPVVRKTAAVELVTVPLETLQRQVQITDVVFPADGEGRALLERPADTLLLPDAFSRRIAGWLKARGMGYDPYAPAAYQRITFQNQGDVATTLLLTSRVVQPETGLEHPAFVPRAFEVTGGAGQVTTLVRVPPHAPGTAVIPVYAAQDTPAGQFALEVQVRLLGAASELYQLSRPLVVERGSPHVLLAVLGVAPWSLGAVGLFLLGHRRLLGRLKVTELTIISLFGALGFAAGFSVEVFSSVLNAVLGPFNLFVGGVIFEILHHLVLTTLLVLLPRVGVATLAGLTFYLLRTFTTGQLSPIDLLFVGSSLSFKELWLWLLGVTRGAPFAARLRVHPGVSKLRILAALTLASGLTAYTSLALHTAFYRLYFADWYFVSTTLVGLLAPIPGVLLGVRLALELERVRE